MVTHTTLHIDDERQAHARRLGESSGPWTTPKPWPAGTFASRLQARGGFPAEFIPFFQLKLKITQTVSSKIFTTIFQFFFSSFQKSAIDVCLILNEDEEKKHWKRVRPGSLQNPSFSMSLLCLERDWLGFYQTLSPVVGFFFIHEVNFKCGNSKDVKSVVLSSV